MVLESMAVRPSLETDGSLPGRWVLDWPQRYFRPLLQHLSEGGDQRADRAV